VAPSSFSVLALHRSHRGRRIGGTRRFPIPNNRRESEMNSRGVLFIVDDMNA